jgi:hypothetical protein
MTEMEDSKGFQFFGNVTSIVLKKLSGAKRGAQA